MADKVHLVNGHQVDSDGKVICKQEATIAAMKSKLVLLISLVVALLIAVVGVPLTLELRSQARADATGAKLVELTSKVEAQRSDLRVVAAALGVDVEKGRRFYDPTAKE